MFLLYSILKYEVRFYIKKTPAKSSNPLAGLQSMQQCQVCWIRSKWMNGVWNIQSLHREWLDHKTFQSWALCFNLLNSLWKWLKLNLVDFLQLWKKLSTVLIGVCSAYGRRISSSVSGDGEIIRQALCPDACGFSSARSDVSVQNCYVRRQQSARTRDHEVDEIDSKLKNRN